MKLHSLTRQNVCRGQEWKLLLFYIDSYLSINLIDHVQIIKN